QVPARQSHRQGPDGCDHDEVRRRVHVPAAVGGLRHVRCTASVEGRRDARYRAAKFDTYRAGRGGRPRLVYGAGEASGLPFSTMWTVRIFAAVVVAHGV